MDMQVDAQLIRNERLKRAWSQEQLAQVSGLGLRTVQRIENGGNASLETVKALAAVLELPVDSLLAQALVLNPAPLPAPSRYRLFKPWRTFVTGCATTLITMGGFVAMQLAVADQVDMDFRVRLDNEEITRSRVVGEAGTPAVVEVSEVLKISITPTIMKDGTIFLQTEIYLFEEGEYKLHTKPRMLTLNGQKAVFKIGDEEFVDEELVFHGVEVEIVPMIE